MSFRDKMAKKKKDLQNRHTQVEKEGGRKYGSIFDFNKKPKDMSIWRPGLGEHEVDIVPFFVGEQHPSTKVKQGDLHFVVRVWVYMRVGHAENPYVSPYDNWEEPDPIREWMSEQGRLPTDVYKKVASKERCVFYVWVHDNEEEENKGLQIWEESAFNSLDKIQEQSKIPKGGGHIPFSDIDDGSRLFFTVKQGSYEDSEGKMQKGKQFGGFKFMARPKAEKSIPEELLEVAAKNPIDEMIKMHVPYEELYKAHYGKPPPSGSTTTDTRSIAHDTEDRRVVSDEGDATGEEKIPNEQERETPPDEDEIGENECPHGNDYGHPEDFRECNGCDKWKQCVQYESDVLNKLDPAEDEQQEETEKESEPDPEKKTSSETNKKKPPRRRPPRRS